MSLAATERPRQRRSRVHGPRKILGELYRLRVKLQLAAEVRAATDLEQEWCRRTLEALDRAITAGEAVVPGFADPRAARTVRKR